jgi:GGDEF domain-containing protein
MHQDDDLVFASAVTSSCAHVLPSLAKRATALPRVKSEIEKTSRFAFEEDFQVSFSIGVSSVLESLREIIHEADMKMYEFKRANKEKMQY